MRSTEQPLATVFADAPGCRAPDWLPALSGFRRLSVSLVVRRREACVDSFEMNGFWSLCKFLALGLNGVFLVPGSLIVGLAASHADTSPREQTEGAVLFTLIGVIGFVNIWMAIHGGFVRGRRLAMAATVALNFVLGTVAAREWSHELLGWGVLLPPIPILILTTSLVTVGYVLSANMRAPTTLP